MKKFDVSRDILALDFDGFIVDSIKECLVSGYDAYANYKNRYNIELFEQLDSHWVEEARRLRNFIRNGEDYVYIAHALENKANIQDQEEFDAFVQQNIELCERFSDHMVNQRLDFSRAKPDVWVALNPLYAGMRDFLIKYPNKSNLYIITTKKLIFVEKILQANAIELYHGNVRDTAEGLTKKQIIAHILKDRRVKPEQFYFVDDQVDTLIKVQPIHVNPILAEWGYNTFEQIKQAKAYAIVTQKLDEFLQFFHFESPR